MGILESHPLGAKSPARLRREAAVIDRGGVTKGLEPCTSPIWLPKRSIQGFGHRGIAGPNHWISSMEGPLPAKGFADVEHEVRCIHQWIGRHSHNSRSITRRVSRTCGPRRRKPTNEVDRSLSQNRRR